MNRLDECEPMVPLLAAFARGTKRSRLRQLVVVCLNGHTLAEVFPTADGPYVVWRRRDLTRWEPPPPRTFTGLHQTTGVHVEVAEPVTAGDVSAHAACRCTERAVIWHDYLLAGLAARRRRVVVARQG